MNDDEFTALGRTAVAFASLENTLVRLSAVKFDVRVITTKAYVQSDVQRAVTSNFARLLNNAVQKLEELNPIEEVQNYINEYLKPSTDEYGRKLACPLIRWRNTLVHGAYSRLDNGNLFIDFHDRFSFESIKGKDDLIHGGLSVQTNANELNKLAFSITEFTIYLLKSFNVAETFGLELLWPSQLPERR
ncbi:hypothetical protein [Paracoccus shandongensis]|uniref:hypothetical protein n=1 Tax=Paracoccus shandongensis TaxID=2816048 RepID=UPI001A8EF550|nr:hypothetical protein [Paracoccus shandongensis]